jgi:hypothetical protein
VVAVCSRYVIPLSFFSCFSACCAQTEGTDPSLSSAQSVDIVRIDTAFGYRYVFPFDLRPLWPGWGSMVKLLRKFIYPACLLPSLNLPPPNKYQLLAAIKSLKDPELVEVEEEVEGSESEESWDDDEKNAEKLEGSDDEEARSPAEQLAIAQRGEYLFALFRLLKQLWAIKMRYSRC